MSTHIVAAPLSGLADVGSTPLAAIRPPTSIVLDETGDAYTFTFEPDLTPAELATFDLAIAVMRSGTGLSPTDYQAIRTQMQVLRAMRQQGRNAYVNLTEAERNRQTYDCLVAITEIFLTLTRETP